MAPATRKTAKAKGKTAPKTKAMAKVKATCKKAENKKAKAPAKAKAKGKVKKEVKAARDKVLKSDYNNVYSRTYHMVLRQGGTKAEARARGIENLWNMNFADFSWQAATKARETASKTAASE